MKLTVDAAGEPRVVEVQRTVTGFSASVGGRPFAVDVARSGHTWSLIVGDSGRSYDVAIVEHGRGSLSAYVDGREVLVAVAPPGTGSRGSAGADASTGDGNALQQIVAPMPGRIVKVLVKVGDEVAARQGVVVVEAMKMENELRATNAGVVTEVRVMEGASVDARAVLVVIGQRV